MAGIPKRIFPLKRRKKRLRGFTRFLRDHQQRAAVPEELDLDYLAHSHRDYHKLGLAPWAVNTKPPLVIRKLWVSGLVAEFQQWHSILTRHHSEFYLAVWLYEPEFGRSQLVAGIKKNAAWYEESFQNEVAVPLPLEYQSVPGISTLKWTPFADIAAFSPDEFAELSTRMRNKPHSLVRTDDNKLLVLVQIGVIWVGRAAT